MDCFAIWILKLKPAVSTAEVKKKSDFVDAPQRDLLGSDELVIKGGAMFFPELVSKAG